MTEQPPDWKQDQAETSRLAPARSSAESAGLTNIERVRLALAMADAGYEWDVELEYVEALLKAYDDIHTPAQPAPAATVERPKCRLCGQEDGACICAHFRPRSSAATGGERERIARIIDPLPWRRRDAGHPHDLDAGIIHQSLVKADAIIRTEPQEVELTEEMLAAGARALADDVWHPPQKFNSLPQHDQNKFKRQALLVLKAASSQVTRPNCGSGE